MQYHDYPLKQPLSDYIQSMWALESENDEDVYPRSIIMPDGIVELIFHYEAPFSTHQGNHSFIQPQNFAISMMKEFVEIESAGKTGFISVRFYPWGAYHFFDVPIQNFVDQTIDAVKLWGSDPDEIIRELRQGKSMEERFRCVELFLLEKLKHYQKRDPRIDGVLKFIRQTKGELSIAEIGAETGFSKKQLERKFLATVGILPKGFSRITRFLNICQNLEEQKGKTLTQLSHECGFYDQAHFIKDFKAFSGFTPKEFFEKENVYFSEI